MCDDGIGGSVKWEVAKHLTNVPTYQRTNVTFGKLYVRSIGEKTTLYYIYEEDEASVTYSLTLNTSNSEYGLVYGGGNYTLG